jgi:hypothetical protein
MIFFMSVIHFLNFVLDQNEALWQFLLVLQKLRASPQFQPRVHCGWKFRVVCATRSLRDYLALRESHPRKLRSLRTFIIASPAGNQSGEA